MSTTEIRHETNVDHASRVGADASEAVKASGKLLGDVMGSVGDFAGATARGAEQLGGQVADATGRAANDAGHACVKAGLAVALVGKEGIDFSAHVAERAPHVAVGVVVGAIHGAVELPKATIRGAEIVGQSAGHALESVVKAANGWMVAAERYAHEGEAPATVAKALPEHPAQTKDHPAAKPAGSDANKVAVHAKAPADHAAAKTVHVNDGDSYWSVAKREAGAHASNKAISDIMGHLQIMNGNQALKPGADIKA